MEDPPPFDERGEASAEADDEADDEEASTGSQGRRTPEELTARRTKRPKLDAGAPAVHSSGYPSEQATLQGRTRSDTPSRPWTSRV